LNGRDERGRAIVFRDPQARRLNALALAAGADPRPLLGVREIFSADLARSPIFVEHVGRFLRSFYENGARATLRAALADAPDGVGLRPTSWQPGH
jgi:mannitol-1-phosphate/altronate dehydrogenase